MKPADSTDRKSMFAALKDLAAPTFVFATAARPWTGELQGRESSYRHIRHVTVAGQARAHSLGVSFGSESLCGISGFDVFLDDDEAIAKPTVFVTNKTSALVAPS